MITSNNEKVNLLISNFQKFQAQCPEERIYLHLDKPLYKPGETIWFQAYVRDGATLAPSSQSEILYIEFLDPKGNKIHEYTLIAKEGIASGDIYLGKHLLGGMYKIRAYTAWQKKQPNPYIFEKEVQLQKVILPRLKMKIEFIRKSYSPGQEAEALLEVSTLENLPLSQEFTLQVLINGKLAETQKLKLDTQGKALLKYKLPSDLTNHDALFNVLIPYQGTIESITRSIPIHLGRINLQFYPEGGDLIAGLPTHLAFAATNEWGKPTEIAGYIQNAKGEKVASFRSLKYGLGKIHFTPLPNETYTAIVTEPPAINTTFTLPNPLSQGFVMNVQKAAPDKLDIILYSTLTETVTLLVQVRSKLYLAQSYPLQKGKNTLSITLPTEVPAGVAQLTLVDSKGIPRAERLAFVNENKQLKITIKTDKEKYLPREKVTFTLQVTDERNMPVPGQFSLAVVDDKLLSMQNDKSSNILTALLLEPDVKDKIEEVTAFMDPQDKNAPELLDLLLTTRLWRRFTWQELPTLLRNTENLGDGERAIIEGRVFYQNYSRKGVISKIPLPGSTLEYAIGKDSIKIITDSQGRYIIRNLELYEPITVLVKATILPELKNQKETITTTYTFTDYGKNQDIIINSWEAQTIPMPFAAMRGRNRNEKLLMAAPALVQVEEVSPLPGGAPQEDAVLANLALEEASAPEEIDKDFEEYMSLPREIEMKRIAPREKELEIEEKPTRFYRARQFAAPIYDDKIAPSTRNDFRTTLYWKSNLILDRTGSATLTFYNSDDISAYRIIVEGIGAEGSVGHAEKLYYTQLPFSIQSILPNNVAVGDRVKIPVILQNHTTQNLEGKLEIQSPRGWKFINSSIISSPVKLPPQSATTLLLAYDVIKPIGKDTIILRFEGAGLKDAIAQEVITNPRGFPAAVTFSGQELKNEYSFSIQHLVEGSIRATFSAFPTTLDEILKGLESMVHLPTGCFEQASSSNYPNLLVLQYMREANIQNPTLMKKINQYLEEGYKKLISYETQEKGFEWFGATPAHEALTAYGLMEFKDMQAVYPNVDKTLVSRTAQWLLGRRDGKGGFLRDPKALDSFGAASPEITNAYITWALSEAGIQNLGLEIENVYHSALRSQDPYQLALLALTLWNVNDNRATNILKQLLSHQNADGSFTGKTHSITRSQGISLQLETTALAALAMMASTKPEPLALQKAIEFMLKNRNQYGGYGTTQSTILVLKALIAYARFAKRTQESGTIELYLNGQKIASQTYQAGQQGEIKIEGWEKYLSEGKHQLKVQFSDTKVALPFHINISWYTTLPGSSPEAKIALQTQFLQKNIRKGETARLKVTISNLKNEGQPMTLAQIGIPGGLQPEPWQLKELQEKRIIDFYELSKDAIYIYYRQLLPVEKKEINLDLKAAVPGTYLGPASCSWLYYAPETRYWVPGLEITIEE
ncbi:MAG: MG2 domain-containing protein [Bacteroidia bacterium]|nr:MG2 domain-containing protein [Bacteroidia bacterium]